MKFYKMSRDYSNYSWRVTASLETRILDDAIDGGIRPLLSSHSPYWDDAPVLFCKMVHQFYDKPKYLLSDEIVEEMSSQPDFLPDILPIYHDSIVNPIHDVSGGIRMIVSDKLKKLMDEKRIIGAHHTYKLRVYFKNEMRVYWLIIFLKQIGFPFIDYVDLNRPMRYKEGDNFRIIKGDEVQELYQKDKQNLYPMFDKEKILHLNSVYHFVFYRIKMYVSEDIKSLIDQGELRLNVYNMAPGLAELGGITTPEKL